MDKGNDVAVFLVRPGILFSSYTMRSKTSDSVANGRYVLCLHSPCKFRNLRLGRRRLPRELNIETNTEDSRGRMLKTGGSFLWTDCSRRLMINLVLESQARLQRKQPIAKKALT